MLSRDNHSNLNQTPVRPTHYPKEAKAQLEIPLGRKQPWPEGRNGSKWALRKRAAANLLRMGHCAPTVMQTLLDASGIRQEWLVRLSAGMPGGIGNTGFECGAMTSPLVLLGLSYNLRYVGAGLPRIFDEGHALFQKFLACHKTLLCREIRQKDRFPRHCIRPVSMSAEVLQDAIADHVEDSIPAKARVAYCRLYSHMVQNHFHCGRAVLERLSFAAPDQKKLLNALSAFMGGTLFMGLTCSAFTAGVMAIGFKSGEIENNPLKVAQMLKRMTFGGNAFDERINKFNRTMNAGHRLSKWFAREFGSTQCRSITRCDFSTLEGVYAYIRNDDVTHCRIIAAKVAERVEQIFEELKADGPYPQREGLVSGAIISPSRLEERIE